MRRRPSRVGGSRAAGRARGAALCAPFQLATRAAGVLLHPTSLPGPHGIGDLGPAAYRFVDFLHAAGLRWWQMLPVGPAGPGNSPYSARSAFGGSPLLISLERLVDEGLLSRAESRPDQAFPCDRVAYPSAARFKLGRLRRAYQRFVQQGGLTERAFQGFCTAHAAWLDDYAHYMTLRRRHHDQPWTDWPRATRPDRAIDADFELFLQFQFDRQWIALKHYANTHGIGLIGDIPIFVAHDSSDVWAHRELFDLAADGRPRTVSGVPPDYFSRNGQLWGHPQYRWTRHRATGFAWWVARFRRARSQFDAVRIDHFLGFNRVWAVPARARTARHGVWVQTPGGELFAALRRQLGRLEIIAEDLGLTVPEAVALRARFGFPGMRLLHFAFGNDAGDRYNQPHTYPPNCVVYPGTHDNETTVGWFGRLKRAARGRITAPDRSATQLTPYGRLLRYLGTDGRDIQWDIIRLALASPANTAIIPMQDVLGLGNEARLNRPATVRGNWEWRMGSGALTGALARRLCELVNAYGRRAEPGRG